MVIKHLQTWQRFTSITALLLAVMLIVAFFSVFNVRSSASAAMSSSQRVMLFGQRSPLLQGYAPSQQAPANTSLHLSIGLNTRNGAQLDALLIAQDDVTSPLYHSYITSQEFTQRFGPDNATIDAVTSYLREQGITVESVSTNHLFVTASASVARAEHAFGVGIANYALQGRTVYAPTSEPSVPTALAGKILTIAGLDNVAFYHPIGYGQNSRTLSPRTGPVGGYTPAELRTAYDINPLLNNGNNGAGQTVAIFALDGYKASDVNAYLSNYGLGAPKYSNVLVDGASGTAGPGAAEVETDMEITSALAPGAAQKIYIGPNTTAGLNDTYNRIVTDNSAKVASTSWGQCEANAGQAELAALDTIFKQAAAQGQAFFASSGDSGAYDCNNSNLAVDFPASDPHVIAVGGTKLQVGNGGSYGSESAWSCTACTSRGPKGAGGGGGISSYFARPSYQTGKNITYANRAVPDVSADADPTSGYSLYCTVSSAGCPSSGWILIGGTSAAAPLWAALAIDINHYLASRGKSGLGSASATIYRLYNTSQMYSAYHDVTTGNNLYYAAASGYDLATGIGTPDGWNFARDAAGDTGGTTTQLLANPGFEDGQTPWQASSSQIINTTNPHTGNYSAYLCGDNSCIDEFWQAVTLPANTTKLILSYWLAISTQETGSTCADYFYTRIRAASGAVIATVQTKCNTNANGWTQYTFDLTPTLQAYFGQQIQVYFEGTTNSSLVTNFFVDDVALDDTSTV